ncbi:dienelactone hydrolase family protein [Streptomyces orinoci]|uniref:Dienelactone hydrolase family protein n=1 Tax=Streptomyces orinoci TaxID=67339 RepID=A0ABV3JS47_STRON|nr:dienelactone hydrolase family protein [Streptomyces orinoci]
MTTPASELPVAGSSFDLPTPDGAADCYLAHPADGGAYPGVLMYTDAFGLRPRTREMADRLAAFGYAVLVPNVFHRRGRAPVVELPGFIGDEERPVLFKSLMPLVRSLTPEVVTRDAGAYLDWLAASPLVAEGPFGVIGYCMGAVLTMRTAAARPGQVVAGGCFHGGNLVTDSPDSPHLLAGRIRAELYFGHADQDRSMTPQQIATLDRTLTEAGVPFHSEVYRGAHHGYTAKDASPYDAAADARHLHALVRLLRRTLPM